MKQIKLSDITKLMWILVAIGAVAIFIFSYDKFNKFEIKFVVTYIIFLCMFIVYMIVVSIFELSKLKWVETKKRLIRFLIIFTSLVIVGYSGDYFFMPDRIDLFKNISIAFGVAFGIVFMDLLLSKKI